MAILAAGAVLQLNITGTYTSITELTSIGGPDMTVTDVDVTTLLSTGRWKEFLAGFKDGGTVTMEANYKNTVFTTLFNNFGLAGNQWRLIFSDGSKIDFNGHINGLKGDNPLEAQAGMPWSVKLTGVPVFTQ